MVELKYLFSSRDSINNRNVGCKAVDYMLEVMTEWYAET